jgi:anthranilate synthase component 1
VKPFKVPTFEAFAAAAPASDLVALTVPLTFDHETAVTLADRFADEPHVFLLESASAGRESRYSFLGFSPLWTYTWSLGAAQGDADPITGLEHRLKGQKLTTLYPEGARLGGPDVAAMAGPVGFFGYDTVQALEPSVGKPPPKALKLPDAYFFMPRQFLVLDHLARRLFVSELVPTARAKGLAPLRAQYDEAVASLSRLVAVLGTPHHPPPLEVKDGSADPDACAGTMTKGEFMDRAARCLEEIRAGEIFQIQIGNRLSWPTKARPFDIFRHLRTLNPSPYMFYYKFGEEHLVGASPELMVGVQGRRVTHRPIAGTRKRHWDAAKDAAAKLELTTSEKERAEHVMLVDLGRNDVGRVAAPGTVKVEELMTVEEYSHVFHMVSQVSGELRPDCNAFEAMRAAFPNGTVSGAPKIRAMQLINELEKASREFYAGALGLFDMSGNLRSTLLIRTIHVARGVAATHASAGIVYDSVPEHEWQETRNKMAACLAAMQLTE